MTNLEHAARIVLTALDKADLATDTLTWWDERELLRHALEPSVSPAQALDDEYAACPRCGDPLPDHMPDECRPHVVAMKAELRQLRAEIERLRAPSRATPEEAWSRVEAFIRWVKRTPNEGLVGNSRVAYDAQIRILGQLDWYVRGGDFTLNAMVEFGDESASRATPEEEVIDFLVAYYGFQSRAAMDSHYAGWLREVKLIQSWASRATSAPEEP